MFTSTQKVQLLLNRPHFCTPLPKAGDSEAGIQFDGQGWNNIVERVKVQKKRTDIKTQVNLTPFICSPSWQMEIWFASFWLNGASCRDQSLYFAHRSKQSQFGSKVIEPGGSRMTSWGPGACVCECVYLEGSTHLDETSSTAHTHTHIHTSRARCTIQKLIRTQLGTGQKVFKFLMQKGVPSTYIICIFFIMKTFRGCLEVERDWQPSGRKRVEEL